MKKKLKIISGVADHYYRDFTIKRGEEEKHKAKILELIKAADSGIQDISLKMLDIEALPDNILKELKKRILKKAKEESTEFISDVLMSTKKYN